MMERNDEHADAAMGCVECRARSHASQIDR